MCVPLQTGMKSEEHNNIFDFLSDHKNTRMFNFSAYENLTKYTYLIKHEAKQVAQRATIAQEKSS